MHEILWDIEIQMNHPTEETPVNNQGMKIIF